jgi:hypothetical protein
MFSQRNNPYCDLLKISGAKIKFFFEIPKNIRRILYFWGKIVIDEPDEDDYHFHIKESSMPFKNQRKSRKISLFR